MTKAAQNAKSQATDKPQAADGAAPRAPRKQKTTTSRKIKDPVKRSEVYVQNTTSLETATHVERINEGKQRAARLRELLEPLNEPMIKVMADIALNKDHRENPDDYPSIHASIRLEAADRLLTRLHGKPKETVVHETDDAPSGDEVLGLLNNILTAVGAPLLELPEAT